MDRFLTDTQPSSFSAKRKSDAAAAAGSDDEDYVDAPKPAAKKPRASTGRSQAAQKDVHAEAKRLVHQLTTSPDSVDTEDDLRGKLLVVAKYAAALETGQTQSASGTKIVKEKTASELEDLAEKLRKTVRSQIKKTDGGE